MTAVPQLRGWIRHEPPIVTGEQERPVWTLAALGDQEAGDRLVRSLEAMTEDPSDVSLTPLRWSVWAVLELLVVPLAHDGIEIDANPDQVGVVLDDALVVSGHWLGEVSASGDSVSAARVGRRVRRLVEPVMAAACVRNGLGLRQGEQILRGTFTAGVRRIEVACADPVDSGWADEVLLGALSLSSRAGTTRRRHVAASAIVDEAGARCATA